MIEFHKIWIAQCEAARNLKDAFGVDKALGYLIGEKFLNFLQASDGPPGVRGRAAAVRRGDQGDLRARGDPRLPGRDPPGWRARAHRER